MAKILSVKEKNLQKKLIPLNIFVCILSLIAIISLYFAPIIKLDVGKALRNEEAIVMVDGYIEKSVSGTGEEKSGFDVVPVVSSVVRQVVTRVQGSVSLSAFKITQLALVQTEDKLGLIVDDLTGENGVVQKLIDSVAKGVTDMFVKNDDGHAVINGVIEDAVVNSLVSSLGSVLPEEEAELVKERLTDAKLAELKTTFVKINDVKSEEEVIAVVDEFVGQVSEVIGEDNISPEDEQAVRDFMVDLYNDTMAEVEATEGAEFNMEAMICVAVSQNVSLEDINLSKMLEELLNKNGEGKAPSRKALAEEEPAPPAEKSVSLTYNDLLGEMGLSEAELENLSSDLTAVLRNAVNEEIGDIKDELSGLGWVYDYIYWLILAAIVIFIIPWFFLALISFFKIFAKNKRFMMWYVKLYSFIPGLIALALLLAPVFAPKIIPLLKLEADAAAQALSYINIACAGISSFTWISGLCFVALWIISVFWAFPIKHKIRRERKYCKRAQADGTYKYEQFEDEYGYAVAPENTNGYGAAPDLPSYGSTDGYYDNTDYGDDSSYYYDDDEDDGFDSNYNYEDYDDLDDLY